MNWKASARACTACGKPEAFPTHTRYGVRHDCGGCGRWAWGEGQFGNAAEHRLRKHEKRENVRGSGA